MELLSPRRPEMFPLSSEPICTVAALDVLLLHGQGKQERAANGPEVKCEPSFFI